MRKKPEKKNIQLIFIKPCFREEIEQNKEDNIYLPPQPYINLFKVFSRYKGQKSEEIFFDSMHFNELGYKLLAEEIYRVVSNYQIIKLNNKKAKL